MNIAISPERRAFIEKMVEEGKYASEEDVVNESLLLLQEAEEREQVHALVAEGMEQIRRGEGIPAGPNLRDEITKEAVEELRSGMRISNHVKYEV